MSGEARIQAAAVAIRAAWTAGQQSAGDLAAALDACGLLKDPQHAPAEDGVADAR
ncbi:hypothetical protein OG264_15930 [Streptomyces xanthophaeus]|uniref:hypothetical protein n=1 Tax=Streptomyces xanthophaeus TaxID=67385 RepID=UPI00386801B8|nr:hypothetical protein OG264_15930 [Streptomyces xanthophaeus]WST62177.1 hypothetical protein OG605_22505 [Streptomyces xanthophaeus]